MYDHLVWWSGRFRQGRYLHCQRGPVVEGRLNDKCDLLKLSVYQANPDIISHENIRLLNSIIATNLHKVPVVLTACGVLDRGYERVAGHFPLCKVDELVIIAAYYVLIFFELDSFSHFFANHNAPLDV